MLVLMAQVPVRLRLRRAICANIVAGIWPPGSTLPGRETLARNYHVSLRSLQQCIDDLIADGHVISHGGHGTVVATDPPCLRDVLLLLPDDSGPGLATSLRVAAGRWARGHRFRIGSLSDMAKAVDMLLDHRICGCVVCGELDGLDAALRERLLAVGPVVVIGFMSEGFVRLHLDLFASVRWALRRLIAAGHRRIAVFGAARRSGLLYQRMRGWLRTAGADDDPCLLHELLPPANHVAPGLVDLLWSLPLPRRPDAVLITDDHLVPALTRALARVGVDPKVVLAHANRPGRSRAHVACQRYGFDADDILRHALELLGHHGHQPVTIRTMQPRILAGSPR